MKSRVKPEPGETSISTHNGTSSANVSSGVAKKEDVDMKDELKLDIKPEPKGLIQPIPAPAPEPAHHYYTIYNSVADIQYLPENALKDEVGMVKALKACINNIKLGSKMRKEVWLQEIERWVLHRGHQCWDFSLKLYPACKAKACLQL